MKASQPVRYYLWGWNQDGELKEDIVPELREYSDLPPAAAKDRPYIEVIEYEPAGELPLDPQQMTAALNRPRLAAHRCAGVGVGQDA